MTRELAGSAVVVTGASSAIGRAVALASAQPGARLLLVARREEPLVAAAVECEQRGAPAAHAFPADVCDAAALEPATAAAEARFGVIDVWVNNAGVTLLGRFGAAPD